MKSLLILAVALPVSLIAPAQHAPQQPPMSEEAKRLLEQDVAASVSVREKYDTKWDIIESENVSWVKRVYRSVKTTDNYLLSDQSLGSSFADILITGLLKNEYQGYSGLRFTDELSEEEVKNISMTDKNRISSFLVKEDWLFLEKEQRLVVRVIGIAPLVTDNDSNQSIPLCWFYYPQTRSYLAKQKTASADPEQSDVDRVFFGHYFAGNIQEAPLK